MSLNSAIRAIGAAVAVTVALFAQSVVSAGSGGLVVRDLSASPVIESVITPEQIDALEDQVIRTRTDFTDGVSEFEGPLVVDVLRLAGRGGWETARMVAANDYAIEIPVSDFETYGVILAHTMNGVRLSRRDKGPYWVMYPLDGFKELDDPVYNNRLIWQLTTIELR